MNRALSIRSRGKGDSSEKSSSKHRFTMASLRGIQQPELSKKLYKLIKAENHAIGAYETAGKEQAAIASQLSEWGEETGDDAISDISDKLGVLLSEIAEQEDVFAQGLEDSRSVLKEIRNTESSVQPSRDHKTKIQDEIQKLKYKEPSSTKIVTLEQELVRAEAQSLVAEAQLTNITRQKFKEAYDVHTAAIIERAEKQIMLARNARHLLDLLDDTPIVPGDAHPTFEHHEAAKEILNHAEAELKEWQPNVTPIHSSASGLGSNAMPTQSHNIGAEHPAVQNMAHEQAHSYTRDESVSEIASEAPASTTGPSYTTTHEPTYTTTHEPTYTSTSGTSYTTSGPDYTTTNESYSSHPTYTSTTEPTYTTTTGATYAPTEPHYE